MASRDYEEFIGALNERRARYLIVGAHAVAFHAQPRATKDLDLLVEPTAENARRVLDAMSDFFGGADLGYGVEDLTDPGWIVQLGVAPVRIDLHAGLEGLPDFESVWAGRVDAPFGTVDAHYLGLDDLLRAKEAAGREQDRADLAALRRVGR
jgi:hypothetical protein